jgi:putative radical SAM enzyme (TIGR03279 family)
VEAGGIAAAIGLRAGDRLLSVNGRRLRDLLDYKWSLTGSQVNLTVGRDSHETVYAIEKPEEEELGLTFTSPVFDGVMTCRNRCVFCFLDQLPAGLRPGLYVRDDDYRLSFLQGNFVTLTNLEPEDFRRIEEYRLSPLYVSVHATDPERRGKLLGTGIPEPILPTLERLARANIGLHTQVVICPGLNDGQVLERTVEELAALGPAVRSIGLVAVGITRHRARLPSLELMSRGQTETVLRRVEDWQRRFARERGHALVHAADELYLAAGIPVPAAAAYDDFPQLENGIGLVRTFLDAIPAAVRRSAAPDAPRRILVLTGLLAERIVEQLVKQLYAPQLTHIRVAAVTNRFFGATVTVAGLLTGSDLLAAARAEVAREPADLVIIPSVALGGDPPAFLDGITPEGLERALGVPVRPGGNSPDELLGELGREDGR